MRRDQALWRGRHTIASVMATLDLPRDGSSGASTLPVNEAFVSEAGALRSYVAPMGPSSTMGRVCLVLAVPLVVVGSLLPGIEPPGQASVDHRAT